MYGYFNIVHILYLCLPIVLIFTLYYAFRDRSRATKDAVLWCLLAVSAGISLYNLFSPVKSQGWIGLLNDLPLYQCDVNILFMMFAIISHGKHETLNKYILYFGIIGPIYTIVAPITALDTYYFYEYQVWGGFLSHICEIVVGTLYLKFNHAAPSSRNPWRIWIICVAMLTVVHGINLLLWHSGLDPGANYFFTMRVPESVPIAFRVAEMCGYSVPWIRAYIFMVWGYTWMIVAYYFAHKLLETDAAKRIGQKLREKLNRVFDRGQNAGA